MSENFSHFFKVYSNPELFNIDEIQKLDETTFSTVDPKASVSIQATRSNGTIFIFYFGAVAFLNVPQEDEQYELEYLFPVVKNCSKTIVSEKFVVIENSSIKPRVNFNSLVLDELTEERSEVVASVVAQSATMEYYEKIVHSTWANVDQFLHRLKTKGTISPFPGKLHKSIARSIVTRSQVVRVLHLLDRPDLIWDDSTMDTLYSDLRASFDLPERFQALEYKLSLIQDTLGLLLDTSRDRRAYWLEATIVGLILFEIVVMIFEKF